MSECKIHKGELHLDTMLPIDDEGQHILYGYRLCGYNDCINPDHVTHDIKAARAKGLRPRPLFHHRNDITGEQLAKLARNMPPGTKPTDYVCAVPHCIKPARALYLCNGHHLKFTRWRKANGITRKRMSLDASDVLAAVQPFYGVNHLKAKDRYCHIEGCTGAYAARGLCKKHHHRYLRVIKQTPTPTR
jgi:hypothetical protein